MKYKYFLILFLAVLTGLGHITFGEDTDIVDSVKPSWMDSVPNADLFLSPDATQEELDTLIDSEQRLADIEASYKIESFSLRLGVISSPRFKILTKYNLKYERI